MTRRESRVAIARGILVGALAVAGCHEAQSQSKPEAGPARSSLPSPWVAARAPSGLSLLEAPAEVLAAPGSVGVVAPPATARVTKVYVRAGERVDKGARVVEVLMPELVTAAGNLGAATTRIEAYRARKQQLEQLRAEGLARAAELADVVTKLAEARADQQGAEARLAGGGLDARAAQRLLSDGGALALTSPVAGVVVEIDAVVGEQREPGRPFARIAGGGDTRIAARLAHAPPSGARFQFQSASGEKVPLTFISEAPLVDARDGTRPFWFTPASGARLLPGQSGRLHVMVDGAGKGPGLVAVPAGALSLDGDHAELTLRDGAGDKRITVEVIATSGADALVRGPIAVGDQVAAEARPRLSREEPGQ